MGEHIYVTKSRIPVEGVFNSYLKLILDSGIITNNGPCLRELETKLKAYLDLPYLLLCNNGTTALMLILEHLGLRGKKVAVTPFTYVATLSALLWLGCIPVFVDIDPKSFCLSPQKLNEALNQHPDIACILAVHIYGLTCNLKELEDCCKNHAIPLVYDAAQAFGSKLADKSLLSFGNYSICSFHATKIFHTGEGGCIVCHSRDDYEHISKIRAFGHIGDEHYQLGINGKMSEIHAAMGLALLEGTVKEIEKRKQVHSWYKQALRELPLNRPSIPNELDWNYGYYPILLPNESTRLLVEKKLNENNIHPRRYFYPALNTLPYLKESWRTPCPVAEDAARRVLCLPMYGELPQEIVRLIADCIQRTISIS